VSPVPSRVAEHAAAQAPQRERECRAREQAVQFAEQHSPSCRRAAQCLNLSPRTLAHWKRRQARGERLRLRGRPCREVAAAERAVVGALLDEAGPRLGLPALQTSCPETPRSILAYLQTEYRRRFQQDHRLVVESLRWERPGAVWAIDHSQPPRPVDGCYDQVLAIRDLASGMQLAWTAVAGATAVEALPVLESLVRQYGPPLVLKSDNGSAFISHAFQDWLEGWEITPLFSPVRMPRYNGACEAGIGGAKRRTEYSAARCDRLLDWTSDDLYAAQLWANHDHYPWGLAGGTPAQRFERRLRLTENERDTFQALVVQYEQQLGLLSCTAEGPLTDTLKTVHHRQAVRQALEELGYLTITRRSIPQPIQTAKCAKIT
jgi:transposase InsO family protein